MAARAYVRPAIEAVAGRIAEIYVASLALCRALSSERSVRTGGTRNWMAAGGCVVVENLLGPAAG